ncbi:hypothetical protein LSH36_238g03100 [Paralvinella palmiformis]|uniref:BHLH domain-containing protein n=1 Tax=Paralvinella palmiformis TaxID=53620 RepID=A0AAD9JN27_9ANNE|nr:hypothetical protein LSH36_238g03100 [Paralvinella palmiformis]
METISGSACYGYPETWTPGYPTSDYVAGYEIPTADSCGDLSLPVLTSISMAEMNKQCLSRWYYYHNEDFLPANIRQDDDFIYQQSYHPDKLAAVSGHHGLHPTTIARRNERERNRVKTINSTFAKLRQHLPCSTRNKKLSKVQILRSAIQYINQLQHILDAQQEDRRQRGLVKEEGVDDELNGDPGVVEVTSSRDSPKAFDSDGDVLPEVDSQSTSVLSSKSLPSVASSHVSSFGEDVDDEELMEELSDWMN